MSLSDDVKAALEADATLMALLAARSKQLQERRDATNGQIMDILVPHYFWMSHFYFIVFEFT